MLFVTSVHFQLWSVKMFQSVLGWDTEEILQCLTSSSLFCDMVELFKFRLLRRSRLLGGGSVYWLLLDQPERQCWRRPWRRFKHTCVKTICKITEERSFVVIKSCLSNSNAFSPMVTPNYQKGQSCIAYELCTCKVARGRSEGCWPWRIKQKEDECDNMHDATVGLDLKPWYFSNTFMTGTKKPDFRTQTDTDIIIFDVKKGLILH